MTISVSNQGTNYVPEPVARVAETMSSFGHTWSLCGGWAVDAWLGRQMRDHHDVDIAIFTDELGAVSAHFPDWRLIAHDQVAPDDTEPWSGRWLEFPAHIHARLKDGTDTGLEFCINERSGSDWVLSHEPRITMDLSQCVEKSGWGLPTLVPEIILFYKALEVRPQDEQDFRALLPALEEKQVNWLREAIVRVQPSHPWLVQLSR